LGTSAGYEEVHGGRCYLGLGPKTGSDCCKHFGTTKDSGASFAVLGST